MRKPLALAFVLTGAALIAGCSSDESNTFDLDIYLKDFNRAVPADEDDRQLTALQDYFETQPEPYCSAFAAYEDNSEDEQVLFVFSALSGYSLIIGAESMGEKTLTYAVETLSGCLG